MILLKIAITVAVVTTLSIIAERVSPRAAGILSGYPLGSAIALFFIGMERGVTFAGASALYNIAGLAALLTFLFTYYWVSARYYASTRILTIAAAATTANLAFLAAAGLFQLFRLPSWCGLLVAAAAIFGYGALFRRIPNAKIRDRVRLRPGVLLIRAALAALIILMITGAARLVPSSWAGLFSAYPATAFPLILILHSTYGHEQAHTIIKNIPTGLWSLVLYSLTVSYVYPRFGIYWGTLMAFGVATLYLLGLAFASRQKRFGLS